MTANEEQNLKGVLKLNLALQLAWLDRCDVVICFTTIIIGFPSCMLIVRLVRDLVVPWSAVQQSR